MLKLLNYRIQQLSIVAFSIGLVGLLFTPLLDPYFQDNIGGMICYTTVFFTTVYQILVSIVSTVTHRKRSLYYKYFVRVTMCIILCVGLGFLLVSGLAFYSDYALIYIYLSILIVSLLGFMSYFWSLTYRDHQLTKNHNVFEL